MLRLLLILISLALPIAALAADDDNCGPQEKGVTQFLVTPFDGGYTLLLPPALVKKFPNKAEYNVTLGTTDGKTATVTGIGQREGENFLKIATSQKFNLASLERNGLESLDVYPVGAGPTISSCSGCPRDNSLFCLGDCSICYCEHKRKKKS
jgi:hypothetical protein